MKDDYVVVKRKELEALRDYFSYIPILTGALVKMGTEEARNALREWDRARGTHDYFKENLNDS